MEAPIDPKDMIDENILRGIVRGYIHLETPKLEAAIMKVFEEHEKKSGPRIAMCIVQRVMQGMDW